jgi:uncharacterized membrane protein
MDFAGFPSRTTSLAKALLLAMIAAPIASAADDCANPTPLTVGIGVAGRTDHSAPTPGIPASHCGGTSELHGDEWFSFTAPFAAEYTVTLCGSEYDTVLSLWDACPDGVRAPLDCNDDDCFFGSTLRRTLAAGERILIRVGGRDNFYGEYRLLVDTDLPPPANDNCEDALQVGLGRTVGATMHATVDGASRCDSAAPDVWYRFTAPATGPYTFDTCDILGFDTILSLRSTCGGFELDCNNNGPCQGWSFRSLITRNLHQGESVLIRVSGFIAQVGTFALNVSAGGLPPPPVNDECSGAIPLANGDDQPFDTTWATTSGLSLGNCGGVATMQNDIFFAYTATCTGEATITTCGTAWDTVLAVYDRCGGRLLRCNNNDTTFVCVQSSGQSVLKFPAVQGRTYTIAVGAAVAWRDGRGIISAACVAPPGCAADYNTDGFVDGDDLLAYVWCFERGICRPGNSADINRDGFVDFFDYDDFIRAFEEGC